MAINNYQIAKIVLSIMASTLHSIGFWALWKVKQKNLFKVTQRMYLLHLSVAENVHSLFLALYNLLFLLEYRNIGHYMFICGGGGAFLWYMSVMIWLTADRLLAVHLNVGYISKWGKSKTKLVLNICFWFAFINNILLCLYLKNFEQSLKYISYALWFPVDNLFILLAVCTYPYIMFRITRQNDGFREATPSPKLSRSSSTATSTRPFSNLGNGTTGKETLNLLHGDFSLNHYVRSVPKLSWKTFLVPSLLILTFVIFIALPDNTYFCLFVLGREVPSWFRDVSFIVYPIGISLDAVIYILFTKDVRRFLMKKFVICCSCVVGGDDELQQKHISKHDYNRI